MKKIVMLLSLFTICACQPLVPIRDSNLITAVGIASITSQDGNTLEDKKFRAMRASKLDAYRELSEQVYGVQIIGEMRVHDQRINSDSTQGLVNGIIRAAKVLTSYQVGDSYVTELELDLKSMKKMSSVGEAYHVPRNDNVIY